jgi:hypothetical protein
MPPHSFLVGPELDDASDDQQDQASCSDDHGPNATELEAGSNTLRQMQAFKALSSADKWRVRNFVLRGEAPRDPRMAAAAVELAESCGLQGSTKLLLWLSPVVIIGAIVGAIFGAVEGDLLTAALLGLTALVNIGQLALNPATRPKNVARSLEASRQVVAQVR